MEGHAVMDVTYDAAIVEEVLNKRRIGLIPDPETGVVVRRIYTLADYMELALQYEEDER